MSEFQRLRAGSPSEFTRTLLGSAERDAPSSRSFRKAASALGLGAGAFGVALRAAASTGAAFGAAPSAWLLLLKPLAVGILGGLVVSVGAHRTFSPGPTEGVATLAPSAVPADSSAPAELSGSPKRANAPDDAPTLEAGVTTPKDNPAARSGASIGSGGTRVSGAAPAETNATPDRREPTGTPAASVAAFEVPASATPKGPSTVSIGEEIAVVDRAREALRQGDPRRALGETALYAARWPSGVLAPEVSVLCIEANLALGDRVTARREARAFLAAQPAGRYTLRIRALFEPSELE